MPIKTRYQKQLCVYWAPGNVDSGGVAYDNYGQPVYSDPVEKVCRWEDVAVTFVGMKGTEEVSKSVVFVDDVVVGGLLLLGDLSSALNLTSPRDNEGAWEIRQIESVPDRRANVTYTWAIL
jgi:hypothetical protein